MISGSACPGALRRVHREAGDDRRDLPVVGRRLQHPEAQGRLRRGQGAKPLRRPRSTTGI